jgi:hypothetical protein
MIRLVITKTAKGIGKKEPFQKFDQESHNFSNMQEAKKYLKEQYGKSSKDKMFIDTAKGKPKHIGYIYKFKQEEFDRDAGKNVHYIENDWVEFQQVKSMDLSKEKLGKVV